MDRLNRLVFGLTFLLFAATEIGLSNLAAQKSSAGIPDSDDEFAALLERLRKDDPGVYEKVKQLPRDAAIRFLRERYGKKSGNNEAGEKSPAKPGSKDAQPGKDPNRKLPTGEKGSPDKSPSDKKLTVTQPLPARTERFERFDRMQVGDFSVDLCRREDGAFGLGEIRRGSLPLRRADFLATWQVDGSTPRFDRRDGLTILLRDPAARLTFTPETRESAGTKLVGFHMQFHAERGPIVETASWELGGSTRGLTYFDGYRGWHAPPDWIAAAAVPDTNPKLMPSLLHGTGFQFEHGEAGSLVHFHTNPGDRLRNVSRGESLEFETTFHGPTTTDRFIFTHISRAQQPEAPARGGPDFPRSRFGLVSDSRINLWTRAFEVAHAELRRALDLPDRSREIYCLWPPFDRRGFRETAEECAAATAREGFTAACIDVIWDNYEFHGGKKNMNVWDYSICDGYGGERGLRALVEKCHEHNLIVVPWIPTAHLVDLSPVWREHPDWLLGNTPSKSKGATGPVYGDLHTGFHDYFRDRTLGAIRQFGFDGAWMDSHLSYAGQPRDRPNSDKLATIYRDFIHTGARQLIVEGDASALGSYGIGIDDSWNHVPGPDLFYNSTMLGWANNPNLYQEHFRRYVASGAAWVVSWDFLFSPKLSGPDWDAARREVRQVLQDYKQVKDRMMHRFVHEDGSGHTWTNDRDETRVVWLLQEAQLPDGRRGEAGKVYVVTTKERSRSPAAAQTETARFLKPSGAEWVFESEIQLRETKDGMVITSVTGREKSNLKLVARFDSDNRLVEATVTTERGDEKQSGSVVVTDDKARVTRHSGENTELDCPRGVLVTSAPDWTDAFLMTRRYDRARGGKQEFAGLWIHPTQQPLRPTFTITRQGEDTVEPQGESVRLDRFAITLRSGSRYVGWSDTRGRLIRLVPESAPRGGIVLEGWERGADKLRAPEN